MNNNMRMCFVVLVTWFAGHDHVEAVLVRCDHMRIPDGKDVYVFFELHNPVSHVDEAQLMALSEAMRMRDVCKMPVLHLMVEVPSLLAQIRSCAKKVTYNLVQHAQYCSSVVAEDIEIRCVSLAAMCLLSLSRQEMEEGLFLCDRFNARNTWCCAADITFEDVLRECHLYEAGIAQDLRMIASIRQPYVQKLEQVRVCEQDLIKFLGKYSIRQQERIADVALHRQGCDSSFVKSVLTAIISSWTSHLFDMHILRKLVLSPYSCRMVIVGRAHATWLCGVLEQMGYSCHNSVEDQTGLDAESLRQIAMMSRQ
jgi:hypothetical protein